MYSDNEQVGSLGKSYTKIDEQITTQQALQMGRLLFYSLMVICRRTELKMVPDERPTLSWAGNVNIIPVKNQSTKLLDTIARKKENRGSIALSVLLASGLSTPAP